MADIYIDPSAATNGTGTAASPRNTWSGVPVAAGNRYFQKRGTVYTGAFPSLTSGTPANKTVVSAYANTDGSDNTALPKPVISIGDSIMPGTVNSPKTDIRFYMVDLRNSRTLVEADKPIMWLGNGTEIVQCSLTTNLIALYGEKVSNVLIDGNTITCATATGTVSMNAIVIGGAGNMDNNAITGNTIRCGNGGNAQSHMIRCEASGGFVQTNLNISYNVVRPINGVMSPMARRGISVINAKGGVFAYNNVALMHAGFFSSGSENLWIHHNSFNNNGAFGIHVTTNTKNFLIEWNTCNQNGGNYSWMNWYGRGIELSAGGELYKCHAHIVRFNKCNENFNFGGPSDNATEGVGIGLDDASTNCLVYGNVMKDNEGNGLQLYGGSFPPDDTGGHIICNNWFINNATQSYRNRRSGTKYLTDGACHLGLGATRGARTVVANNLFVGSYGGIRDNSLCDNLDIYNNVFQGQTGYAIGTRKLAYRNATGGSYYDATGALKKSAGGLMRLTYDPLNLAAAPYPLIEPEATNHIRNNTMQGVVAGQPGTRPNLWGAMDGENVGVVQGITRQIVGTATENGVECLDIRYSGTATSNTTLFVRFESGGGISASVGQKWAHSAFHKVTTGASPLVRMFITERDSAGVNTGIFYADSTALSARLTRHQMEYTTVSPSTTMIYSGLAIEFAVGQAYDFTLRIGLPQLERDRVTSPIKTSGTAVTRAADLPEIHHNIYSPAIPRKIASLATDVNGVPSPATLSSGLLGDQSIDPKLDNKYQPSAGSPLLNVDSRNGIPWFMMPVLL